MVCSQSKLTTESQGIMMWALIMKTDQTKVLAEVECLELLNGQQDNPIVHVSCTFTAGKARNIN